MSTEEKEINARDLFVTKFNDILDTLTQDQRHEILESIFYNPDAPMTLSLPEVMPIVLYVSGISKKRYETYRRYGHDTECEEFQKEYELFLKAFTQVMSVKNYIGRQPAYRPHTGLVNVKTLPLNRGIHSYLYHLEHCSVPIERTFKAGRCKDYINYIKKIIETFQIFKHDISGLPNELY